MTLFQFKKAVFRLMLAVFCIVVAQNAVRLSSQVFMAFDVVDQCNTPLPFPVDTTMHVNKISTGIGAVNCQALHLSLIVLFLTLFVITAISTWFAFLSFGPKEPASDPNC